MTHPFDSRLEHRALGSAAITATAVLDTITQRAASRTAYRTLVTIESCKISANDELYQVVCELSDDDFSTVAAAVAVADFGATEVRQSGAPDTAVGDTAEIMWSTEYNGAKYQYARLRLIAAGTSPSIGLGCFSSVLGNV
jgi:hypothetical protein